MAPITVADVQRLNMLSQQARIHEKELEEIKLQLESQETPEEDKLSIENKIKAKEQEIKDAYKTAINAAQAYYVAPPPEEGTSEETTSPGS